ncbi:MAG: hypothetical protein ACRELU_04620 [Gemmatimonadota bacterium]
MDEILPGVFHWTTHHEGIGARVHSFCLEDADGGVLVDPRVPEEGMDWFRDRGIPHDILLTNRHHHRHSGQFAEAFGSRVHGHAAGMHEFTKGEKVEPFEFGAALPNGFLAVEVGVLCPEETAFHTVREGGILFLGDSVVRWGKDLGFVPEEYIGDDPPAIKKGIRESLARILDELEFQHLCLAHGEPILDDGAKRLRAFVEAE